MSLAIAAVGVLEAFAGLGGQALGWHRAGAEHVAFIERDPFCRRVLARHWPPVPRYEDVTTFNASPFRGRVDVLTGGPPCQPVSTAGRRGGTADERWLWGSFVALAVAVEAPLVVVENPPGLLSAQGGDAMWAVLGALGAAGYSVEWDCLAAGTLGAPHRRERVFLVARRDGRWTWPAVGAQSSMFPGRPAAWPWSGRWERHTLMTRERRWPTPSTLPWEVAAEVEALPTPRVSAERSSRGSMVHNAQWSAVALEQAIELKSGILPREFHDESELTPGAARMLKEGRQRRALPTPQAADGERASNMGIRGEGNPTLLGAARRRALPTPVATDGEKAPTNSLARVVETGDRRGRRDGQTREGAVTNPAPTCQQLSPALPEWMLGLPDGWSRPDGPSLLAAPGRPYLPDLTAELALTTEREHRRPRLRALGNACQVEVAEVIARAVLASARQDREHRAPEMMVAALEAAP